MNKEKNSRLVYSTDTGRIKEEKPAATIPQGDGVVRIRRETAGRNGKGVTTVTGIPLDEAKLKDLAKTLKVLCGVGGSVKDGVIEIQGDQRDKLKAELEKRGFNVKLAGVEVDEFPFDPQLLKELVTTPMPYGKYAGHVIADIPEHYLMWMAREGFPKGKLGNLLGLMYEIRLNGLEGLLKPLKENPRYFQGDKNLN